MSKGKKLKFLVEDGESLEIKSALPIPGLGEISHKIVELSEAAVQKGLNQVLSDVLDLLTNVTLENDAFSVSEMRFTLAFDAAGQVSIVSLAKASLTGRTGMEFTITRKT